jgi:hypothetical protein
MSTSFPNAPITVESQPMTDAPKKTPITINGNTHLLEDMTEQQQAIVNHITDLDQKIRAAQFNLDQLNVGREAFVNMLVNSTKDEEND